MNPLISVIVPVYNVEKYLDRCVESIVNQTYTNLEIILVDDGSPDNCPQMCDDWAKKDERIKVIHKENGGLSSARNAGLRIMQGKYLCFVDSDDYIDLQMIELATIAILQNQFDICIYNFSFVNNKNVVLEETTYTNGVFEGSDVLKKYIEFSSFGASVCNKLYKSFLLINNHLFFDESIKWGEDHRFNYKVFKVANSVVGIKETLYYYLNEREGSITYGVTSGSINRWRLTKYIIEQERNNEIVIGGTLSVYAGELVCILRELLRSNNEQLIDECYDEICREITTYYSDFMSKCNLSKAVKYSVKLIHISPRAFKVLYRLYLNKVKK